MSLAERLSWQGRQGAGGAWLGTDCPPSQPPLLQRGSPGPELSPESEVEGAGAWEEASTGLGLSLRPVAPSLPRLFTEPSPRGNFKASWSPRGNHRDVAAGGV